MKKLLALFIITASTTFLQGDCGYGGCVGVGGQPYGQGGYYPSPYDQGSYYSQGYGPQGQGYYQGGGGYGPDSSSQYQPGYGQYQPGYSYNPGYGYQDGTGSSSQSDQQLTEKIQSSLKSFFSSKYDNVNASVYGGNVTLTGTVTSADDRNNVEQKVRAIPGVQNVNNQVQVLGPAQGGAQGQGPAQQGQSYQGQGYQGPGYQGYQGYPGYQGQPYQGQPSRFNY